MIKGYWFGEFMLVNMLFTEKQIQDALAFFYLRPEMKNSNGGANCNHNITDSNDSNDCNDDRNDYSYYVIPMRLIMEMILAMTRQWYDRFKDNDNSNDNCTNNNDTDTIIRLQLGLPKSIATYLWFTMNVCINIHEYKSMTVNYLSV